LGEAATHYPCNFTLKTNYSEHEVLDTMHDGYALLGNYGFSLGDEFKFSAPEVGEIILEKIRTTWIVWK